VVLTIIAIYSAAMPDQSKPVADPEGASQEFVPFKTLDGDLKTGLLLICDHASNALPARYGMLGLEADQFKRHIAYDIGVEAVVEKLARALGCPAVLSQFSRLLIDPNRGGDDPTLVMKLSDGAIIPGNRDVDAQEVRKRAKKFYAPYHEAIDRQIDRFIEYGKPPALLSIHSFTPHWRGHERIWHGAVLWDNDPRFALALIAALRAEHNLVIGDNEPYSGKLKGDCLYQHGTKRGLAHGLLEIRQDLISDEAGIDQWAGRLSHMLPQIMGEVEGLNRIEHFGSQTD